MKNIFKKNQTIIIFFLTFLFPIISHASIAFDTAASSANGPGNQSIPMTLSTNATALICGVYYNPGDEGLLSVTYNSVPLTRIASSDPGNPTANLHQVLFGLMNPSTGAAYDVVVSDGSARPKAASCASYSGVGAIGASGIASSTNAGSLSTSVTTSADNAWLVMGVTSNSHLASDTGTTLRSTVDGGWGIYDSNGPKSPVGTYSLTVSNSDNNGLWEAAAELKPATMTPPPPPPSSFAGSGTLNRLAKFTASSTIGDSLFSDNGSNITLTSGNFLMPLNSILDTVSNGALNFGTTNATTLTFGRSGQNMIISANLFISTLDRFTPGLLTIGLATATSVTIGHTGATTILSGQVKVTNLNTISNCNSAASPAICGSAPAGSVAMAKGHDTLIVNTTAVTANSQIFVQEDSSLGSRLGVTCNANTNRNYTISARSAGISFTIKTNNDTEVNKACLSYFIVN